jgi:hypothetical protein
VALVSAAERREARGVSGGDAVRRGPSIGRSRSASGAVVVQAYLDREAGERLLRLAQGMRDAEGRPAPASLVIRMGLAALERERTAG